MWNPFWVLPRRSRAGIVNLARPFFARREMTFDDHRAGVRTACCLHRCARLTTRFYASHAGEMPVLRHISLLAAFLLLANTATAATLVTWQSVGEITLSQWNGFPPSKTPPAGTPYELTMSWDADTATRTVFSPPGSSCFTVSATGSLSVGAMSYGLSGSGFTQAQLPGSNCSPGARTTQFLFGLNEVGPDQFILGSGFMEVFLFNDLLINTFPVATSSGTALIQLRDSVPSALYLVQGRGNLTAFGDQQPTPVPEPATMTLLGLGLAAVVRRACRSSAVNQLTKDELHLGTGGTPVTGAHFDSRQARHICGSEDRYLSPAFRTSSSES